MEDVLLLLGASSELGTRYLRDYGERYKIIYAHYHHESKELIDTFSLFGERVVLIQDDLNAEEGGDAILTAIRSKDIWPNCICHCAAPNVENIRFLKGQWGSYQKNLNIMVRSVVRILPEVFKHIIREKKKGRCVFIISSCSDGIPPKFEAPYVTGKYALLGLMRSLSTEYAGHEIMVNGISPGMMETKFLNDIFDHIVEENAQKSPFGRNLLVDEVIPMVDFLLSEKADRITGQNIIISGGM